MANTSVVPTGDETTSRHSDTSASELSEATSEAGLPTPSQEEARTVSLQGIRQSFELAGISPEIADFLTHSWSAGTKTQYEVYITQWVQFCAQRDISVFQPSLNAVLEFLLTLFRKGLSYNTINVARSALSTIIKIGDRPVGQHAVVIRFFKSVFRQRPTLPKTTVTWDVDKVLQYLYSLSPVRKLNRKLLTFKLLMLLLLLAGSRGQSAHLLDVRNMTLTYSSVTFRIGDLTKTTKPGVHVSELAYRAYAPNRRLCIVTVLKEYLKRTLNTRGTCTQLLMTYGQPYKAAARGTIRRWTSEILVRAGIDLSIFSPHSTRSASTSKAAKFLPLATVLKTAGWSRESTFRRYYEKPVDHKFDFCQAVLH